MLGNIGVVMIVRRNVLPGGPKTNVSRKGTDASEHLLWKVGVGQKKNAFKPKAFGAG